MLPRPGVHLLGRFRVILSRNVLQSLLPARTLEALNTNQRVVHLLLFTGGEHCTHSFGRGHVHEPEAARAAARIALWVTVVPHRGMRDQHAHNCTIRSKVVLELPGGLEAELVDSPHNEKTVRVLVGKQLQARGEGLNLAAWPLRLLRHLGGDLRRLGGGFHSLGGFRLGRGKLLILGSRGRRRRGEHAQHQLSRCGNVRSLALLLHGIQPW
mmetsp:Transcript_9163/g.21401  ORF Transcript_9163/g.21401 Transcript_9163/m.21401 type:complete len:212 (+) Transcript_9163:275-910(+)